MPRRSVTLCAAAARERATSGPRSGPILLLVIVCSLMAIQGCAAIPIESKDEAQRAPPLIEFKNGGIRLNFAGYHAEAGLGGLLTGSKTGGGLHVSAGTPSGASASAGLGGLFENGTIGGGLHARATLGSGGPEAKAGLGGVLGGTERSGSKTTGVLYADSNLRDFVGIPKIEKGVKHKYSKNIQVIPPANPTTEKIPAADTETNSVALKSSAASPEKEKEIPTALLYAFGNPKLTKDDEGKKQPDEKKPEEDQRAIERLKSTEKKIAEIDEILKPDQAPKKRKPGIFTRIARDSDDEASSGESGKRKFRGSTLFDDIFNIPISALNAVNQLLKNNIGKRNRES